MVMAGRLGLQPCSPITPRRVCWSLHRHSNTHLTAATALCPPARRYLIIFNVDVMKTWAGFASLFLGFSFIFGNSIRTMVSGVGASAGRCAQPTRDVVSDPHTVANQAVATPFHPLSPRSTSRSSSCSWPTPTTWETRCCWTGRLRLPCCLQSRVGHACGSPRPAVLTGITAWMHAGLDL